MEPPVSQLPGPAIPDISVEQLEEMARNGGAHILDVREDWEFKRGRVPGAMNLPLSQLQARVAELPRDKPYAVICEHGMRSLSGADFLLRSGFAGVVSVRGGTSAWVGSKRPIEKD
jgi:rhodanese-related sulfurtransferase